MRAMMRTMSRGSTMGVTMRPVSRRTMRAMTMRTTMGGSVRSASKQALTEQTLSEVHCCLINQRRDNLDIQISMLGVNLDHNMRVRVFGLAGLTQVIVMTDRALKSRAMKVANVATIAHNSSMACGAGVGNSSAATHAVTITSAVAHPHHHHDTSRHLIGMVNLHHRVRGRGSGFTSFAQIVVITNSALEAGTSQRHNSTNITLNTSMGNRTKHRRRILSG
mmetsp:Transcript_17486/g.29312  ORF Transcript_17486/g.29312 Transcript_17486/m.29312 type:complete len:221 (+) Transcript_17486:1-663(+)